MPPFRLQYASNLFVDLHRMKYDTLVKPVSPTLALLGNIGRPESAKTYHFLNYCATNWDKVVWIPGPHELTNPPRGIMPLKEKMISLLELAGSLTSVRLLASGEVPFHEDGVVLLGAPLWTRLSLPLKKQPEFQSIFTSVDEAGPIPLCHHVRNSLCSSDVLFLQERSLFWTIVAPSASLVYLTHTLPTPRLLSSGLKEETFARLPLDCQAFPIAAPVRAWLGGATGSCGTAKVGRDPERQVLVGVNSLFEYPYVPSTPRNKDYDPTRVLELQTKVPRGMSPLFLPRYSLPPLLSSLLKPKVSLAFA